MIAFYIKSFLIIPLEVQMIVRKNADVAVQYYSNPIHPALKISAAVEDNVEGTEDQEEDVESKHRGERTEVSSLGDEQPTTEYFHSQEDVQQNLQDQDHQESSRQGTVFIFIPVLIVSQSGN